MLPFSLALNRLEDCNVNESDREFYLMVQVFIGYSIQLL